MMFYRIEWNNNFYNKYIVIIRGSTFKWIEKMVSNKYMQIACFACVFVGRQRFYFAFVVKDLGVRKCEISRATKALTIINDFLKKLSIGVWLF